MTSSSTDLSVCCLTRERPAMVARILELFRDVADEIVVAMDSRVDPAEFRPLLDVADTVLRFEYVDPPERARPWIVDVCRHPTVLMIDGDEVPSAALIAALPRLVADAATEQFRIARRWCFPDEYHWLAERPWSPDFQRRLVRRGPQLDFDLQVHGGIREAFPNRCVEEALYHLTTILQPFAMRREKARHYERQRPGFAAVGGGPLNDTMYVPEHFATLRPASTPPDDIHALRAVLSAPDRRTTMKQDYPLVSAATIASHVPTDPLEAQGYSAKLRVADHDLRTDPGIDTFLVVEVTNDGAAVLPRDDARGVQLRIATRVLDRRHGPAEDAWARTQLPGDIPPGESRLMEAVVRMPVLPGVYTVEVDLLNERSRWFRCVASADIAATTRWGRYVL